MSTQRVCFCGCMLQMFLQADEPMSSGSGDQADKRRPGWTGKQGKAYRKIKVPNSNCPHDRDAWIGTIKLGRLTSSLNVQCRACGCRINKRYKELRGGMWSLHPAQGRPMGSEVAWLNLECGTCPEYHRSLWNAHDLPSGIGRCSGSGQKANQDSHASFAWSETDLTMRQGQSQRAYLDSRCCVDVCVVGVVPSHF